MSKCQNDILKSQSFLSDQFSDESKEIQKQGVQKGLMPLKKKRIVRKKYKPRKKDVFIHTICILNKKDFRISNSIKESFLIPESQQINENDNEKINVIIGKKDEQYLKKLMQSIKFSQNLNQNNSNIKSVLEPEVQRNESLIKKKNILSQELTSKWDQKQYNNNICQFMPQYLNIMRNLNMF